MGMAQVIQMMHNVKTTDMNQPLLYCFPNLKKEGAELLSGGMFPMIPE